MSTQAPPIVVLTHEYHPVRGGIATYVEEVAGAASRAGRRIEVWAPAHPELANAGFSYPIRPLPLRGSQSWPCRVRLARYLYTHQREWRQGICYLPEPGPLATWMYLQLLLEPPRSGLVVTLHGSEIKRFSSPAHRHHLFGKLLERADRIGVVSEYVRSLLIERFPSTEPRIVAAPGAVRSRMTIDAARVPERRTRDTMMLLTVARIHPRKGQLAVLEALAFLPPELRSRVVYKIAGPLSRPSYLRRLARTAAEHGIALRYLGCLDEHALNQAYSDADVFVMASSEMPRDVEGFGLSYLEASAFGLPVVAHRVGGVEDAVHDGINGILVSASDRRALAEAIGRLAHDERLRRTLGERGRSWAARFSWETTAHSLFHGLG